MKLFHQLLGLKWVAFFYVWENIIENTCFSEWFYWDLAIHCIWFPSSMNGLFDSRLTRLLLDPNNLTWRMLKLGPKVTPCKKIRHPVGKECLQWSDRVHIWSCFTCGMIAWLARLIVNELFLKQCFLSVTYSDNIPVFNILIPNVFNSGLGPQVDPVQLFYRTPLTLEKCPFSCLITRG